MSSAAETTRRVTGEPPGGELVERSYGDGAYTERFTRITVGKTVDADGHTYTETYRITRIEPDVPPAW